MTPAADPPARDGSPAREAAAGRTDALFVLSGEPERKVVGVERWRAGAAESLVLSVGRFEWRRYAGLGVPGDAALRAAVEAVPRLERHFFVVVRRDADEVAVIRVAVRPFGTRRELRALRDLARERGWSSITLLTSGFHRRRVALAARRVFRNSGVALAFDAVPPSRDRFADRRSRNLRRAGILASEYVKLAVYAVFLWN